MRWLAGTICKASFATRICRIICVSWRNSRTILSLQWLQSRPDDRAERVGLGLHPGGVAGVVERAPGSFVHAARAPVEIEAGVPGKVGEELPEGATVALVSGRCLDEFCRPKATNQDMRGFHSDFIQ